MARGGHDAGYVYTSIAEAVNAAQSGDTIILEPGTYTGTGNYNININKDLTIIGENQDNTIIDSQNKGNIFNIASGVTLTLENLTFTNNTAYGDSGTILNDGTVNITNSTFTSNTAESGGAILNDGTLNITNSTFTSNTAGHGGAIYNNGGTVNITNSTFTSNTAIYYGGAIYNHGTSNITNSTFTSNTAAGYHGGAIFNYGTLNITNSTFTSNTAALGGAIYNVGVATINFNWIIDNTGAQIYNDEVGTIDATLNWWGTNNPNISGSDIVGTSNYNPWIVLTIDANPKTINTGGTSQVTADLTHNSNNQDTSSQGYVPDGIPVQFLATLGNIDSTGTIVNGRATATFKAGNNGGQANIQATSR